MAKDKDPTHQMPAGPAPPPPSEMAYLPNPFGPAEKFLQSHGWTKSGIDERGYPMWNDPAGSTGKGELRTVAELPADGGGTTEIKQLHCPPMPWVYRVEEAVKIQQSRMPRVA
jgi:hypothetical protein